MEGTSIADWYQVLSWDHLPNFGSFHTKKCNEEFKKNYYRDPKIVSLYKNICETLKNDVSSANIRLSGDPGAGKTSFLYAIKRMSEDKNNTNILSKFFFYIFHINKADDLGPGEKYKDEVLFHVKRAWKEFYFICEQGDTYTRFKNQNLSVKETVNKLSDYYKYHKDKFNKIMVFAVDDVDLLPGNDVSTIVDQVLKNIEIGSVKKWLVIRKITFNNYSAQTKKRIEQFFPDPYLYPSISLHDLAKHRITHTSCDTDIECKNPFSKQLCDETISTICEGSMREGLSLLKSILEENGPGSFKSTINEKVIQNYLEKCAVKTLTTSQKLIDLHASKFRASTFPIAIDLLICSRFHSSVDLLFGAVNECLLKRNIDAGYSVGSKKAQFKLKKTDFDYVLSLLVEHGLVKKESKDRITITDKGIVTASFATGDFYLEHSKEKNKLSVDDDTYWQLAQRKIDQKDVMDTLQTWLLQKE